MPYFDPPGWEPDRGLDVAIGLLGWECERTEGGARDDALERLRRACEAGPVVVGPIEMGLFTHQPWSRGVADGTDHWVVVLEVTDEVVVMHDPEGYPYVTLPISQFMTAWSAEKVAVAGPYVMRSNFRKLRDVRVEDAVRESLPYAVEWLSKDSAAAVHRISAMLAGGIDEGMREHLAGFAVRLGARRLDDAATWLAVVGEPAAAEIARQQAMILGRLQFPIVQREFTRAAEIMTELAPGYERLHDALK
ncbi:hypothetical protein [Kribbella solani]|uniref:Uncharacterized protein n=1 Tax=Kribbella solani TaxID=236067 RepID=A0A841DJQ8_9ACTN|nr:hypothetical protein [Kribbella solani]MBB5978131.1 hypothetical protein [Kribbella solani]